MYRPLKTVFAAGAEADADADADATGEATGEAQPQRRATDTAPVANR